MSRRLYGNRSKAGFVTIIKSGRAPVGTFYFDMTDMRGNQLR